MFVIQRRVYSSVAHDAMKPCAKDVQTNTYALKPPSKDDFFFFIRGEKLPLRFKTSTIDVEVKYKPAGNELLVPEPVIRMRTVDGKAVEKARVVAKNRFIWQGKNLAVDIKLVDPETQREVPLSETLEILDNYKYKYLAEDGAELKEEDILYFAVQTDGSELECSPYPRTQVFEIPDENWVPSTSIEGFLITNVYEIWSEDKEVARKLFEEAEKRLRVDQIGIGTFSFGGFKQYYVFLVPIFKEGKYVWLMKFSDQKLLLNHLQDMPSPAKLPIKEAPPLKLLPPVAAIVAVSQKKKKA